VRFPAGNDVIGLAQTGSGKTGAFALPILQGLMDKPQELYALVLSPTRELAIQIAEQFEALGSGIGLKSAVLVGGIDMMAQAIALAKRPHVIVGTPGRVVDHLTNTKVGGGLQEGSQQQLSKARQPHLDLPPASLVLAVAGTCKHALDAFAAVPLRRLSSGMQQCCCATAACRRASASRL
jgi:hypothetical protein